MAGRAPITPAGAAREMENIAMRTDVESAHSDADDLLVRIADPQNLHMPHHATCPFADKHRGNKAKKR